MPQSLLTGQLKEKPTEFGVFIVNSSMLRSNLHVNNVSQSIWWESSFKKFPDQLTTRFTCRDRRPGAASGSAAGQPAPRPEAGRYRLPQAARTARVQGGQSTTLLLIPTVPSVPHWKKRYEETQLVATRQGSPLPLRNEVSPHVFNLSGGGGGGCSTAKIVKCVLAKTFRTDTRPFLDCSNIVWNRDFLR